MGMYEDIYRRLAEERKSMPHGWFGEEGMGVFRGILDVVNRPLYMSANIARGQFGTAAKSILTAPIPFAKRLQELTGLPLAMTEGERTTYADVLKERGMGRGGDVALPLIGTVTGRGAAGFGLDIALDPLTYTGLGIGRAVGALKKTKVAAKLGKTKLAEILGRAFISDAFGAPKEFVEMFHNSMRGRRAYAAQFDEMVTTIGKTLRKDKRLTPILAQAIEEGWDSPHLALHFSESFKHVPPELGRLFTRAMDAPSYQVFANSLDDVGEVMLRKSMGKMGARSPLEFWREARTVAAQARAGARDFIARQAPELVPAVDGARQYLRFTRGLLEKRHLVEDAFGDFYFPHRRPPVKLFSLFKRSVKGQTNIPAAKLRKLRRGAKLADGTVLKYGSIREINENVIRKSGISLFDSDAIRTLHAHGHDVAAAISAHDFLTATKHKFGKVATEALEKGWSTIDHPMFKGFQFPDEIADVLTRTHTVLRHPKDVARPLLRVYDSVLGVWKRMTLGIFPAYHSRNLVSNTFLSGLDGVAPNPRLHAQMIKLQFGKLKRVDIGDAAKFFDGQKSVAGAKFLAEARRAGVYEAGFYAAEGGLIQPTLGRIASGLDWPLRQGMRAGRYVENNSRLVHWLTLLRRGVGPEDAARRVRKFLFDFQELTKFEKDVMRRAFPFYSWMRKNVPLQVEMLFRKPGVYAGLGKTIRFIEEGKAKPEDMRNIPKWIKDRVGLLVGHDTQTGEARFWLWGNWLPPSDLVDALKPHKAMLDNLSPGIKVIIELAMGWDSFFERKIEGDEYPGQTRGFEAPWLGSVHLPGWVEHPMRSIRLISTISRIQKKRRRGERALTQAQREVLGLSVYTTNFQAQERGRLWRQRTALTALKRDMRRAMADNDQRELARLQKIYDKVAGL